jgi:hypothetical protein
VEQAKRVKIGRTRERSWREGMLAMTKEREKTIKACLVLLAMLCGALSLALFRLGNSSLVKSGAIEARHAQRAVEMEIFEYLHDHPDVTHTSVIRLREIDELTQKARELSKESDTIPDRHPGVTCTVPFGTCPGFEDQDARIKLMREAQDVGARANELSIKLVLENYKYLEGTSGQRLLDNYATIRSVVKSRESQLTNILGIRLSYWAEVSALLTLLLGALVSADWPLVWRWKW